MQGCFVQRQNDLSLSLSLFDPQTNNERRPGRLCGGTDAKRIKPILEWTAASESAVHHWRLRRPVVAVVGIVGAPTLASKDHAHPRGAQEYIWGQRVIPRLMMIHFAREAFASQYEASGYRGRL